MPTADDAKRKKFWYRAGYITARLVIVAVYLLVAYGVVSGIYHREIPYLPLILLLSYFTLNRVIGIYEGLTFVLRNLKQPVVNNNYQISPDDLEKIVNLIMFKNMHGGGPN